MVIDYDSYKFLIEMLKGLSWEDRFKKLSEMFKEADNNKEADNDK